MDTFYSLCLLILIAYLILFFLAKIIFAIFGGGEKKKSSKKKAKPPKTKYSKVKEVKQDLISVEQLEREESQIKKESFVYLDTALPDEKKFDPNSLIEEKQEPIEDKTSINTYLNETKENEKREALRQRREQFLKELNNPLNKYEQPKVNNKDDDFSSWLIKDEDNQSTDRSAEELRRIQETQNRINLARENFRKMKEAESRSRLYGLEGDIPIKPKANGKLSYEEVESLLDGMEAKQADNKITLKEEFNNLSRDMKIFVLAKMINSDFKL